MRVHFIVYRDGRIYATDYRYVDIAPRFERQRRRLKPRWRVL